MINNQQEKATLKDVYRTNSERIVKKPKWYIDEMWYYLFLTSGLTINKPKYVRCERRNVRWFIWQSNVLNECNLYDFNNLCVLETIIT